MIILDIQIRLLLFSLIFGFLFSSLIDLIYPFLLSINKFYFAIINFFIILLMTIIYFIGIKQIGYITFHIYSIFLIIFGFIFYEMIIWLIAKNSDK